MRFGYWLPMFGGWLRNVKDEGMEASWDYVSRLARRSEEIGFDLTLRLVGTPEQVADRIRAFEEIGVDLLLLQFSPQHEEMERFAEEVMPMVGTAVSVSG